MGEGDRFKIEAECCMARLEAPREMVWEVLCPGVWLAVACFFMLACPVLGFPEQPTAQQMVRLSVASTEADWRAIPHYSYIERDADVKGGATTSKTYQVCMIDGSPYSRLIAIGDEPISPAQEAREDEKLRRVIAKRANESLQERTTRLAAYQKSRQRMFALVQEMAKAFDFRLVGEQKLGNHDVLVLQAAPRPGYQPKSRETKILIGMKGTLWIDKDTYQWIRVEAVAIKPLWMGWFIAQVLPGTRFLLEQTPVENKLWLPEHFRVEVKARVLFVKKNYCHDESYRNYRLLPVSSIP